MHALCSFGTILSTLPFASHIYCTAFWDRHLAPKVQTAVASPDFALRYPVGHHRGARNELKQKQVSLNEQNENVGPLKPRGLKERKGVCFCSLTHGKTISTGTKVCFQAKFNNCRLEGCEGLESSELLAENNCRTISTKSYVGASPLSRRQIYKVYVQHVIVRVWTNDTA